MMQEEKKDTPVIPEEMSLAIPEEKNWPAMYWPEMLPFSPGYLGIFPKWFVDMGRKMDRIFQENFPDVGRREYRMPKEEWKETPEKYVGKIELPGIDKDDINITFGGSMLEILVKKSEERKTEKESNSQFFGYRRTVGIPDNVDHEKIVSTYENGVLTIELLKKEQAEKRKIDIR